MWKMVKKIIIFISLVLGPLAHGFVSRTTTERNQYYYSQRCPQGKFRRLPIRALDETILSEEIRTSITTEIEWMPTTIQFEHVYRSYGEPSFWRRMTSSVPRREFALENINLIFGADHDGMAIYLLVGASSSGKSSILKSILDCNPLSRNNDSFGGTKNEANKGSVSISCRGKDKTTAEPADTVNKKHHAKPILIDDRTVVTESYSSGSKQLKSVSDGWTESLMETKFAANADERGVRALLESLSKSVLLRLDSKITDLTPSERYRYSLGVACIASSCDVYDSKNELPGPILLLDEWMDVETRTVVQKVVPALENITKELGGVILSVTHKPQLYGSTSSMQRITLSAGKVLPSG